MNDRHSIVKEKAFSFAKKIVTLTRKLREAKEFEVAGQIFRSGTSIGANVEEGVAGISTADFSNKISIAYKEARETKYWLRLIIETKLLDDNLDSLFNDCDELCRMCFSILKTTRIKK